jgi:phthalate 4,5-dioxygenase
VSLTREENELLCRVGPGTPMGEMIRRFWVPVCLSEELPEPDSDPIRVRILGEDLVAFRDSAGKVGVMDEHCPHRGASLFFGRNEEGGLRCLYHGWKIDVAGTILETPCEPAESRMRFHIKHAAYPVVEAGDVVWAYLGPPAKKPEFPYYWWTKVPSANRTVGKIDYDCNYVQAIEGAIDSSHSDFLHSGYEVLGWNPEHIRQVDPNRSTAKDTRWEVDDTEYGIRYAAIRKAPGATDGSQAVRVSVFAVPFHCLLAGGVNTDVPHLFVPADDNFTWFYDVRIASEPLDKELSMQQRGVVKGVDVGPDYRKVRTLANNYQQNRQAMREREEKWAYSGIAWGKPHQDMAVIESMGALTDWTKEHLGVADNVIVAMRGCLIASVKQFLQTGEVPEWQETVPLSQVRGGGAVIPAAAPWESVAAYAGEFAPARVK